FASNRPESEAFARSPFASLFELVLDWQSVSGVPVRADAIYAAMRAEESLFAEVRAAEYFPGSEPFELLRPQPTPMWSEPPPSVAEQSTPSAERISEPEPPPSDEVTPPKPRVDALSVPTAPEPAAAVPTASEAEPAV